MNIIKTKRSAYAAIFSQFFLMGVLYSTILSRFPALQTQYQMDMTQLSLVAFFISAGALSAAPLCVWLSSKIGSRKMSLFGFLYIPALMLFVFAPSYQVLYIFVFIFGALMELTDLSMNANSIIVEHSYKRPIIGIFHAMFYVGVAVGGSVAILFMCVDAPLYIHFVTVSAVLLISFFFIRRGYLKDTPEKKVAEIVNGIEKKSRLSLPHGILLLIAFIGFCGRIVEGAISDWSTVYMKSMIDLQECFSPVGLIVYSLFLAFGRLFSDSIRKKFAPSLILLYCGIITSAGLIIMISGLNIYCAIGGLFVAGIGLSCFIPVIYSMAGNIAGVNPGTGLAMVSTISGTGFLFGPSVIGFVAEHFSLRIAFVYVLFITLILTMLVKILRKKERK